MTDFKQDNFFKEQVSNLSLDLDNESFRQGIGEAPIRFEEDEEVGFLKDEDDRDQD